jgi:hypothetical protein
LLTKFPVHWSTEYRNASMNKSVLEQTNAADALGFVRSGNYSVKIFQESIS